MVERYNQALKRYADAPFEYHHEAGLCTRRPPPRYPHLDAGRYVPARAQGARGGSETCATPTRHAAARCLRGLRAPLSR
jgi:hypothetical protein